jgi:imidazolonepropionase-like amidohydrolase
VNAGPRGLFFDRERRRIYGIAAEWYRRGVDRLSICTDAPVVPQEELILQAAVAVRLGLPARVALRGITIEPARAIGIADRVGSIEPGKDADLAVFTGDPLEMRHWVTKVLIRGKVVYDADRDGRRF